MLPFSLAYAEAPHPSDSINSADPNLSHAFQPTAIQTIALCLCFIETPTLCLRENTGYYL